MKIEAGEKYIKRPGVGLVVEVTDIEKADIDSEDYIYFIDPDEDQHSIRRYQFEEKFKPLEDRVEFAPDKSGILGKIEEKSGVKIGDMDEEEMISLALNEM